MTQNHSKRTSSKNTRSDVACPDGWASSISGIGLGLRSPHINEVIKTLPDIPWFEILADNHVALGGLVPVQLARIREHYPITFHCVGMSLAGTDPIDTVYLKSIKRLQIDYQPAWISDHICFTQYGGHHYNDLLPFPFTDVALQNICSRINQVQDFFGEAILIENVSTYLQFHESSMDEVTFINEILSRTDCKLLLDINNVFVNATNHGFDALEYLDLIPLEQVKEIHLAGYEDKNDYLLDTHNNHVSAPVWELYKHVIARKQIPTLIEWDSDIPSLDILQQECEIAKNIFSEEYEQC